MRTRTILSNPEHLENLKNLIMRRDKDFFAFSGNALARYGTLPFLLYPSSKSLLSTEQYNDQLECIIEVRTKNQNAYHFSRYCLLDEDSILVWDWSTGTLVYIKIEQISYCAAEVFV